jgi:hypothetical protein
LIFCVCVGIGYDPATCPKANFAICLYQSTDSDFAIRVAIEADNEPPHRKAAHYGWALLLARGPPL